MNIFSSVHQPITRRVFVLSVALLFPVSLLGQPSSTDSAKWTPEFKQDIRRASKLVKANKGDLSLAISLLETSTLHNTSKYYQPITRFYQLSLKQSSFEEDPKVLTREAHRLMPLTSDSTQARWQSYIKHKNDRLTDEMVQFWEAMDPVISTKVNERMIEHWRRIHYARKHFIKNKQSPYGTDDRGTIYVQFGDPDMQIHRTITVKYANSPSLHEDWKFKSGEEPELSFVLWRYFPSDNHQEHFHIFGKKNGVSTFGLRKNILQVMDFEQQRMIVEGTEDMMPPKQREIAKSVFMLGALERLASYHPTFANQYSFMSSQLSFNKKIDFSDLTQSVNLNYARWAFESDFLAADQENLNSESTAIPPNNRLHPKIQPYEFRSKEGDSQFVLAIDPGVSQKLRKNKRSLSFYGDSLMMHLGLQAFDGAGRQVFSQSYPSHLNRQNRSRPLLYTITDLSQQKSIAYTCEVTNPALKKINIAPGVTGALPKTLVWASGRQKLMVPEPTIADERFDISDVVLGKDQERKPNQRLPLIPNVLHRFEQGANAMIYYEAYHIPSGGYKTTYHFQKDRFLFGPKKIEKKAEITLLNDKAKGRDTKFFSIPLQGLKPDEYTLVLEFETLQQPVKTIKRTLKINIAK